MMRRSNCASALQYVPELTWILFLRILDAQENKDPEEAAASGRDHSPALRSPYRWQDWAAPCDVTRAPDARRPAGGLEAAGLSRRAASCSTSSTRSCCRTCTAWMLPGGLPNPAASPKQRIIGRIMTAVERVRVDSETNLRDILDKVHEISIDHIDDSTSSPCRRSTRTCC
jgi:type I restriction enzyme M protein